MLVNFYIIIVYLFVCEQILNFLMQNVEYGPSKRIKKMSLRCDVNYGEEW